MLYDVLTKNFHKSNFFAVIQRPAKLLIQLLGKKGAVFKNKYDKSMAQLC